MMIRHDRLYCTLLAVLAVYCLCGMGLLIAFTALPAEARPATRWPEWLFPVVAFINGAYFCATVLTLILRRTDPASGRRLTRALNIALLFGPPFGTALGLYGLAKVDRASSLTPVFNR